MQYENSKSIWDRIVELFGRLRAERTDSSPSRMNMKQMFGDEPYGRWGDKIK